MQTLPSTSFPGSSSFLLVPQLEKTIVISHFGAFSSFLNKQYLSPSKQISKFHFPCVKTDQSQLPFNPFRALFFLLLTETAAFPDCLRETKITPFHIPLSKGQIRSFHYRFVSHF